MSKEPPFKKGDRLQCLHMSFDDPDPIAPMTKGTVKLEPVFVQDAWIVPVRWDNGRTLNLVIPPDNAEKIA